MLDRRIPQTGDFQHTGSHEQPPANDHHSPVVAFDHGKGRHGPVKGEPGNDERDTQPEAVSKRETGAAVGGRAVG